MLHKAVQDEQEIQKWKLSKIHFIFGAGCFESPKNTLIWKRCNFGYRHSFFMQQSALESSRSVLYEFLGGKIVRWFVCFCTSINLNLKLWDVKITCRSSTIPNQQNVYGFFLVIFLILQCACFATKKEKLKKLMSTKNSFSFLYFFKIPCTVTSLTFCTHQLFQIFVFCCKALTLKYHKHCRKKWEYILLVCYSAWTTHNVSFFEKLGLGLCSYQNNKISSPKVFPEFLKYRSRAFQRTLFYEKRSTIHKVTAFLKYTISWNFVEKGAENDSTNNTRYVTTKIPGIF